jgi:hypothetical protein
MKGQPSINVDQVIAMLSDVERDESRLLSIIFEGKHVEAASLRKAIDKSKSTFKYRCHAIVNDVHRSDYEELNAGMISELDRHFGYWRDKIDIVHDEADRAMIDLSKSHANDQLTLNDLQQNIHSLMPKCTKDIEEFKAIEQQLVNMNQ